MGGRAMFFVNEVLVFYFYLFAKRIFIFRRKWPNPAFRQG
jgi:hypothetical protein